MNKHTVALLEQHFDTAFSAPDGIKKLRELILTLAMQGKLVPQDPNDQPASELLKEIETEKKRLIKEGKIKVPKPLPMVTAVEVPYLLPQGWEWMRLGEIGYTNIGLTYTPANVSDTGIPVLRSNNIKDGKLDMSDLKRVDVKVKESVKVQENDLLICARNGSKALVGKTALITGLSEEMAFGAFMAIFRSRFNQYLLWFINSPLFRNMIDAVNTMTINQITQDNLRSTICPLPPLPEQHRIVAKIDELMARCDAMEKLRTAQEEKRLAVHTAAIKQLLNIAEPEEHLRAQAFLAEHFADLYTVKANVAELRKAILQLAVMGKLVPQDPNDPPASELLKEIEAEKKRLMKEGKIKALKTLPLVTAAEVQYMLPVGWEWVRLDDISMKIHYGYTASANYEVEAIRLLRITDIQGNRVDWKSVPGCEAIKDDVSQYILANNDILIARTGGTVGKSYLVQDISVDAVFASYLIRIIPSAHIVVNYLKYSLESPLYWKQLYAACSGTGQPNVNGTSLSMLRLPLPPLLEQHRIVTKIDQLMLLCDSLDQQIESSTSKKTALLNAVMVEM